MRRCTALTGPPASSVDRAGPHVPRPQPRGPRAPAAARAQPRADPARARADGRAAGAVRAVDVRRALVAARGLRARRPHAGARAPHGGPGDADAARRSTSSPRRDYWPFAVAVREARRAWWLRTPARRRRARPRWPRGRAAARARSATARSPRTEIEELVGKERCARRSACGSTSSARRRRGRGSAAGRICSRTPSDWLGPRDARRGEAPSSCSSAATSAAFGPATAADDRRLGRAAAGGRARSLERVGTRRFRGRGRRRAPRPAARAAARPGDARAGPLPADLGRDAARPRPAGAASSPRRTAPRSSARRRRSRSRRSSSTARSRGRGATRTGGSRSTPFRRLDAADRRALEEEGERLAAFHA